MNTVLEKMEVTRNICHLAHRLRRESKIPVKVPIKEIQYSGVFLTKAYRDLIGDDINARDVNSFILKGEFDHIEKGCGEEWIEHTEGDLTIALNIHLDDWQLLEGKKAKERRDKIIKRKKESLRLKAII